MRSLKRCGIVGGLTSALLATTSAVAETGRAQVQVRSGPLAGALAELARENGVEILFEDSLVGGKRSAGVAGRLTQEQALTRLLAGTGVSYRATPDGSFVLFAGAAATAPDAGDGAIAELLVVGRRSQNADIRRTENDIQPYDLIRPRQLAGAPQDNIEQLLRGRISANAQVQSPSQMVAALFGANSAVDLRGVGAQRTLVLVDGRRIPSLPTPTAGLEQGDLNAVPLGSIERIETLTATAGGIHGLSAIGGVVNVVLRRDYRGAKLTLASGLSDRGDAGRTRVEGSLGFTPDHGRTDIMLAASYVWAQPLYVGDRDFGRRALQRQVANNPATFLNWSVTADGAIVRSLSGRPLQLDPGFGGSGLDSRYTFLPLGAGSEATARSAAVAANAGRLPAGLPPGRAGERTSLLSTPETASLLLSARRQLSDRLELFADGLYLYNRARTHMPGADTARVVGANAPTNPFTEDIFVLVPLPELSEQQTSRIEVQRLTAGFIVDLRHAWKGSADYTVGRSIVDTATYGRRATSGLSQAFRTGSPAPGGAGAVDPFGDYAALQAAVRPYSFESVFVQRLATEFTDGALRAAGPLVSLPGGPLTLTLLGELRRERIPESPAFSTSEFGGAITLYPRRTQAVRSGYVELRAPLVADDAAFAPFRGLELQVALRRDDLRTSFPDNIAFGAAQMARKTVRHRAEVYTVGARVHPQPWLMLRGSLATGQTPPDLRHLQERALRVSSLLDNVTDPRRGGRRITEDGPYWWARNGFHGIRPEKGRTFSAGVVFNPSGGASPRLSIDYARVELRDEIIASRLSLEQLVAEEALYPDRVVREPLSEADAALGYTGGRITAMHTGMINAGRLSTDTVDFRLDWMLPPTPLGEARLYGAATWQPNFRRKTRIAGSAPEVGGLSDTPLRWRGNAGVEWTRGPLTVDLNAQYFHSHSLDYSPGYAAQTGRDRIAFQGTDRVPSQVYVDLTARRRFELAPGGAVRAVEVRAAAQNLLDRRPPLVADPNNMGYDYYGDPRGRRFELQLSAEF